MSILKEREEFSWNLITPNRVAQLLQANHKRVIIVDSRDLIRFNASHILTAVSIVSLNRTKRRHEKNKFCVRDISSVSSKAGFNSDSDVIIYDENTINSEFSSFQTSRRLILVKLVKYFRSVLVLKGGFLEFQAMHPFLCSSSSSNMNDQKSSSSSATRHHRISPSVVAPHSTRQVSMSQPCMPVSNLGPTKILPYLFLGSLTDALCQETLSQNGITYILNVSTSSPRPVFIQDGHFLRIPVNDSYSDKLSPFFNNAFQFLDKVREASGCVLVHCLAGVSRSPTLAIAYIMRTLSMTMDEAYRYVKDKRPTISPNFNFLGQLLEYERQLIRGRRGGGDGAVKEEEDEDEVDGYGGGGGREETLSKKKRRSENTTDSARLDFSLVRSPAPPALLGSPTTALARLNFSQLSPLKEQPSPSTTDNFAATSVVVATSSSSSSEIVTVHLGAKHSHCATKRPLDGGVAKTGFSNCQTGFLKGQTGFLNGQTGFVKLQTGFVNGPTGSISGQTGSVNGQIDSISGQAGSVIGQIGSVSGQTGFVNGPTGSTIVPTGVEGVMTNMKRPLVRPSSISLSSSSSDTGKSPMRKVALVSPWKPSEDPSPRLPRSGKSPEVDRKTSDECIGSRLKHEHQMAAAAERENCSIETGDAFPRLAIREAFLPTALGHLSPSPVVKMEDEEEEEEEDEVAEASGFVDTPQIAIGRKSRSLEDILGGCPSPSDTVARRRGGDGFLATDNSWKHQQHPSYMMRVLASPVALGLDKHPFRCHAPASESFRQSPSSAGSGHESLELIPVS